MGHVCPDSRRLFDYAPIPAVWKHSIAGDTNQVTVHEVQGAKQRLTEVYLLGDTKGLNKEVIAERVESSDVLAELQSLGIGYAQGHLLGRPRPYITVDGYASRINEA